jgi:hypothetical protein
VDKKKPYTGPSIVQQTRRLFGECLGDDYVFQPVEYKEKAEKVALARAVLWLAEYSFDDRAPCLFRGGVPCLACPYKGGVANCPVPLAQRVIAESEK